MYFTSITRVMADFGQIREFLGILQNIRDFAFVFQVQLSLMMLSKISYKNPIDSNCQKLLMPSRQRQLHCFPIHFPASSFHETTSASAALKILHCRCCPHFRCLALPYQWSKHSINHDNPEKVELCN